jgi:hypothetical protein
LRLFYKTIHFCSSPVEIFAFAIDDGSDGVSADENEGEPKKGSAGGAENARSAVENMLGNVFGNKDVCIHATHTKTHTDKYAKTHKKTYKQNHFEKIETAMFQVNLLVFCFGSML